MKLTENQDNPVKYLSDLDTYLVGQGYKKSKQVFRGGDFAYWKTIRDEYQVGISVYDMSKSKNGYLNSVLLGFVCMPINIDFRCDLVVTKNIELSDFEEMAATFYDSMMGYY